MKIMDEYNYYASRILKKSRIARSYRKISESACKVRRSRLDRIFDYTKMRDKVYVVGSGDSLNSLNENQISHISEFPTIGINQGCLFKIALDIYSIELPSSRDVSLNYMRLIYEKIGAHDNLRVFAYLPKPDKAELFCDSLSFEIDLYLYDYIRPNDLSNLDQSISFLLGKPLLRDNLVMGMGSSLERVITLCLKSGFKEIVLLGVDLNGSKYFWERDDRLSRLLVTGQNDSSIHLTETHRKGAVPITTSLAALDKIARNNYSSKLTYSSISSRLERILQPHEWKV